MVELDGGVVVDVDAAVVDVDVLVAGIVVLVVDAVDVEDEVVTDVDVDVGVVADAVELTVPSGPQLTPTTHASITQTLSRTPQTPFTARPPRTLGSRPQHHTHEEGRALRAL